MELVCWEQADWHSGLGVAGLRLPGWSEGLQAGCAAGAESAESAAGEPSSQRISAAPCGRTDGQPAAAVAGIPAENTNILDYLMKQYSHYN